MFELSTALKYLIPKRRQLSVSLIALMSVFVISLVVWLVLVFLSVTEGIERGWLEKLTHLNAPLKITPTQAYYASYYYQVDSASAASHFSYRTIGEKLNAKKSDPHNADEDPEIPLHWKAPDLLPSGALKDPVKIAYQILSEQHLTFQEFELSGALMRLQLVRPGSTGATQNFLTQAAYVASLPDQNPHLKTLLVPPSAKDFNHLFYLAFHDTEQSREDSPRLTGAAPPQQSQERLSQLFHCIDIQSLKTAPGGWKIPMSLLPEKKRFAAHLLLRQEKPSHVLIAEGPPKGPALQGTIEKQKDSLLFQDVSGKPFPLPSNIPLLIASPLSLKAHLVPQSLLGAHHPSEIRFQMKTTLQGVPLTGEASWEGLEIQEALFSPPKEHATSCCLPWFCDGASQKVVLPTTQKKEAAVLLAKSFQDSGVLIGDVGYLSFSAASAGSLQEHRLPIYVAGFYDPGLMPVGAKCVLAPPHVARLINSTGSSFNLDQTMNNGIAIWLQNLHSAREVKAQLQHAFQQAGIDDYWKITTFHEYEFAKDLLQQFQSDKMLFSLVGIIVLIVACCNIISLLVLLVNDKKKEIGILQAMGAKSASIATIFGLSGILMGVISSLIGTTAALITMHHIGSLTHFLSALQGHDAFNAAFYGNALPTQLSHNAVLFILLTTPVISLCAGLIPALKACRLKPSEILRQE